MLTAQEIKEARDEASKWNKYLTYFEEVYNHSFAPRGYSRSAALIAVATLDFGMPGEIIKDDDGSDESYNQS